MALTIHILTGKEWIVAAVVLGAISTIIRAVVARSHITKIRGPPSPGWIYGYNTLLHKTTDESVATQEAWSEAYGYVHLRHGALGARIVVLADPKAIGHVLSNSEIYWTEAVRRKRRITAFGHSLLTAEGDDHKRHRRVMSSGFTNVKLREYTQEFFNSAHKVKTAWDNTLEAEGKLQPDVALWMNAVSLDSIGLAGFSHDFGTLNGQTSRIGELLESMSNVPVSFIEKVVMLLQPSLPLLSSLPTMRSHMLREFNGACGKLARGLLLRTVQNEGSTVDQKSILGLLIKAENKTMTEDEVNAQMRVLMFAGYATTSVTMTWCFIELCRHPELQEALRKELRQAYPFSDPSWDDLSGTHLPFLDGVVHETLRLHPAVSELVKVPVTDDTLPLGTPVTLADGSVIDQLHVPAGTKLAVPITVVNRMRSLWGEDAWEFKPERWVDGGASIPAAAKDIQGHRHMLTFINGPKTCLGKGFAVAEMKAVMSVLVKNFKFEFPEGPKTKINKEFAFFQRPTVDGQPRCRVPVRITRVE